MVSTPIGWSPIRRSQIGGQLEWNAQIGSSWGVWKHGAHTLWLCQNSYGKWPFIVDFPIENGGSFHSYVAVYQRVCAKKDLQRGP